MYINYYIFSIIILLGIVLGISDSRKNRKIFILIISAVLILQTSLRSLSVGSDTPVYYRMFYNVMHKSWNKIWDEFVGRYLYHTSENDAGYVIMQKTIATFTDNWQVFVFLANLLFFIPLGRLLYRYSTSMIQLVFAFVLYVSMFHIISLSGGRQLYAIGMSIMAFIYMDERKYKRSLFFVFIGTLIHMTCLLSLLPILLSRLNAKYLKIIHLISIVLVPFVILFANEIIFLMGSTVGVDKYARYGMSEVQGGAWTFIGLLLLVSVFCFFVLTKKELKSNASIANLYTMLPLFTLLGPLIYSNGTMIRISMYFHLYLMLLIPIAVNSYFKERHQTAVFNILIVILIILSLRDGGLYYRFFWEEPHLFIYSS